jgi:cytidine deaminase
MSTIDWDQLHKEAIDAMKTAYAPYSKFPVGVSALVNATSKMLVMVLVYALSGVWSLI